MEGTPNGRREGEPLLALDTGEQGGQHSLDLHGGACAHDRLPLVLEQLGHILGAARKGGTQVRPHAGMLLSYRHQEGTQGPDQAAGPCLSFRPQLGKGQVSGASEEKVGPDTMLTKNCGKASEPLDSQCLCSPHRGRGILVPGLH